MIDFNAKVVTIIVSVIFIIFQIIVPSLDIAILSKISNDLSIASEELNTPLSLSSITSAIYVFIGISFAAIIVAIIGIKSDGKFSYFCFIAYSIISIVRDGLIAKQFSCFNYFNNDIVLARASLSIISAVILISIVVILNYIKKESLDDSETKIRIITSIILGLVCLTMIITNSIILNNLQEKLEIDIQPTKIDIAFFNTSEYTSIQSGSFNKDSLSGYRFVAKLSDIIFSQQKTLARRICSRNSCSNYYLRFLFIDIDCTNDTQKFFTDCQQASKLALKFRYVDGSSYPTYNCAIRSTNSTCSFGCPNLNKFQAYLVQRANDNVELAWNGYCNCNKKQPKVILNTNQEVNPCQSKSDSIQGNFYLYFLIYLIFN